MKQETSPLLIVGLGNPGDAYTHTPHNVGFAALDALHAYLEKNHYSPTPWALDKKVHARIARCNVNRKEMILAQPQTFMNLSGTSIKSIIENCLPTGDVPKGHKLKTENCIVLHDDIDLVQGTVRIRKDGSSAGHKGVQNIIDVLGTQEFARIRIGVRPSLEFKGDTTAFVLKKMNKTSQDLFRHIFQMVAQEMLLMLEQGFQDKTFSAAS